ncbi:MAG TPA: DegT/DnrJ/EryC1/StrS family aminotransferase [Bdellovibrionota bacterium]|jgi:dTDP-4-amino-4,6-dideoxygalactose transaminase
MTAKIPLIDVQAQNGPLQEELLQALKKVLESGAFVLGPEVKAFEDDFKSYTKAPFAVGCASGSDALLLPLMAADVGPGDEVLVPSFTFYATAGAVARLGATPVFVDSDETCNLSLADMEKKITPKTKAVIPVHLFGQMVDMEAVLKIARAKKLVVIEDCAQSIGAEFKGKQCGSWGDYGAFSFYPTKNLGAAGDAGLVSAIDSAKAELLTMLRVHGSKQRYYHELVGTNSRLDSLQAAILRVKIRHLRAYEQGRERVAAEYTRLLNDAGLGDKLRLPVMGKDRKHVWNQYTVRATKRDALRSFLADQGIGSEIYYPLAMHRQAAFQKFISKPLALPVCEALEKEVLSLPMYPELPNAQIERVVEALREFYRKN